MTEPPLRRWLPIAAVIVPALLLLGMVSIRPVVLGSKFGMAASGLALLVIVYLVVALLSAHRPVVLARLAAIGWTGTLAMIVAAVATPTLRGLIVPGANASEFTASRRWPANLAEWWPDYCEEFDAASRTRWEPHLEWQRLPFSGQLINVDHDGRRRTWNPPGEPGDVEIWLFGGSTVWGEGARDEFTIPSLVSKELAAAGHRVHCVNFGEKGYTTTQSLISLVRAIQHGGAPDIAVFYEGFNDVWAAFQSSSPGVPIQARNEMERRNPGAPPLVRTQGQELIDELRSIYFANARMVRAIGREYGFEVRCYLQPIVFAAKPMSSQERATVDSYLDRFDIVEGLEPFCREAYANIRGSALPDGFRDIADTFASVDETLYIDLCHVTEEGNRLVAERLARDLAEQLSGRAGAESEAGRGR